MLHYALSKSTYKFEAEPDVYQEKLYVWTKNPELFKIVGLGVTVVTVNVVPHVKHYPLGQRRGRIVQEII